MHKPFHHPATCAGRAHGVYPDAVPIDATTVDDGPVWSHQGTADGSTHSPIKEAPSAGVPVTVDVRPAKKAKVQSPGKKNKQPACMQVRGPPSTPSAVCIHLLHCSLTLL